MMGAISTSETQVRFYENTRRNILEDCNFHTRRRENFKISLPAFCRMGAGSFPAGKAGVYGSKHLEI
jgi:hypothetical protein